MGVVVVAAVPLRPWSRLVTASVRVLSLVVVRGDQVGVATEWRGVFMLIHFRKQVGQIPLW